MSSKLIALFLFADIFGTWTGTSLCTNVRPACHDEKALYHVARSSKKDTVVMTMSKVVDGKEVVMGTNDYQRKGDTLSSEYAVPDGTRVVWTFVVNGDRMTGTLKQLPGGEVVRNIAVRKK